MLHMNTEYIAHQWKDEMPVHADDKLLWIVIGGGLLIAANAIPYYLNYIRTLTEIHHDQNPRKGHCEDAADALKLTTLEKLVASPNYKLRASAVKIIAERSIRDNVRKLLLQDLASNNSARREQALHALWFLLSDSSLKTTPEIAQTFLADTTSFAALTECLVNLLPLHENGPPIRADNPTASSPLLPHNRPACEIYALFILRELLTDHSTTTALSAGLVSKWLKHYPFPCALPENGSRRQDVVELFKGWKDDDPWMTSIMEVLTRSPDALEELRTHGLTGSSYGETEIDTDYLNDYHVAIGENPDDYLPVTPEATRPSSSWSRRFPDPSSNQAERAVRQRRREAAVYSEGNAPLTQDNIFQRQSSNPGPPPETNPEIEAELARMNEEIEREDEIVAQETRNVIRATSRLQETSFWHWLTMHSGRDRSRLAGMDGTFH
jgi:hypothetical protein